MLIVVSVVAIGLANLFTPVNVLVRVKPEGWTTCDIFFSDPKETAILESLGRDVKKRRLMPVYLNGSDISCEVVDWNHDMRILTVKMSWLNSMFYSPDTECAVYVDIKSCIASIDE